MPGFDLSNYEPVSDRLEKWWADHPNGQVHTELVAHGAGEWIFYAAVYCDLDDMVPRATGYAREVETPKGVNSTSACENCETSALGRALANAGYATKARPSREEMEKATPGPPPAAPPGFDTAEHARLVYDALKERIAQLSDGDQAVFADWKKTQNPAWPYPAEYCARANTYLDELDSEPF